MSATANPVPPTIDLQLPIDLALTRLFQARGAEIGIPEEVAQVQYSNKGAQFQCNGALASAKRLKRPPRQLAERWLESFSEAERACFSTLEIAGPGFINISLSPALLAAKLHQTSADPRLSVPTPSRARRVYIDFGGYNVAKQLHIGHLRATVIGDTLQRICRLMGDEVISDVHLGDWGTQMGMLIEAVRAEQPELPYFAEVAPADGYPESAPISLEDMNRLYPAASARSKEDEDFRAAASRATAALQEGRPGYRALWRHFVELSISEIKKDIAPFDVHFDLWLGESDAQPLIPPMIEQLEGAGYAVESEGALIVPLKNAAGEDIVPVMLRKRDGGATYHTSDLATIQLRVQESAEAIFYVVDARQEMHFRQVFQAAQLTGIAPEGLELEHIQFGTINGTDGRPFKTRSGGTVKLRDVVAMALDAARSRLAAGAFLEEASEEERERVARAVAVAAIKFGDLSNHRNSDYILEIDNFCAFEGKTGPYLLYATVRIRSILAKAAERGLSAGPLTFGNQYDLALALELTRFPLTLRLVHEKKTPHLLCEYLFSLSQSFSAFYQHCNIVREPDPALQGSWLSLVTLCLQTLTRGLELLGIEAPERM